MGCDRIACAAVEDQDEFIPGTVKRVCADCETLIWLAPSGQRLMEANPELVAICLACAMAEMIWQPNARMMPLTADQESELQEYYDG